MSGPCPPLRVLVVEDESLLALDIEMTVEECGHTVAGEARCLHSAKALADDTDPHLAFVDVQLARGTSGLDVSAMIQERWPNTMIVFVTANPARILDDFRGAHGLIAKLFSLSGLAEALAYLSEGVCAPPPHQRQPDCFIASPEVTSRWQI